MAPAPYSIPLRSLPPFGHSHWKWTIWRKRSPENSGRASPTRTIRCQTPGPLCRRPTSLPSDSFAKSRIDHDPHPPLSLCSVRPKSDDLGERRRSPDRRSRWCPSGARRTGRRDGIQTAHLGGVRRLHERATCRARSSFVTGWLERAALAVRDPRTTSRRS